MEVVGVTLVALLTAVAGTAVFVMVVIGIHSSERQAGLPGPARSNSDALARRILAVRIAPVPIESKRTASQCRSLR
jgi:VanZ family protein